MLQPVSGFKNLFSQILHFPFRSLIIPVGQFVLEEEFIVELIVELTLELEDELFVTTRQYFTPANPLAPRGT